MTADKPGYNCPSPILVSCTMINVPLSQIQDFMESGSEAP